MYHTDHSRPPHPKRSNSNSASRRSSTNRQRVLIIFGMQQDFFATLSTTNNRSSVLKRGAFVNINRPGAIPVPDATQVATGIRELLKLDFDAVIWCQTCHPIHHCSFLENNPGSQIGSFEFMLGKSRASYLTRRQVSYGLDRAGSTSSTNNAINTANSNVGARDTATTTTSQQYSKKKRTRLQQVIRPTHCVEGTRGAEFHPDVRPSPRDKILKSCTNPQSQSPAVPNKLHAVLQSIPNLGAVYIAGIGISSFVDKMPRTLLRIMPSLQIYGLIDLCKLLNMGDNGQVRQTDMEELQLRFARAGIRPLRSEILLAGIGYRQLEGTVGLHWDDFVQALASHLSITDLAMNRNVLLELLHHREIHMHNSMPSQDWLVRAGFWNPGVIDTLHDVSGENLLHAAARLGDVVFVQELLGNGGKASKQTETDPHHHVVPAKLKINIKSAFDLPKSDLLGLSDPYAVIRIGPTDVPWLSKPLEIGPTEVKYKTLNPVWNQSFVISTDDLSTTDAVLELEIRIFDKDQMSADDLLAEIRIPITRRNCPEEKYPLDKCKTKASICLSWQTTYTTKSLARHHNSNAETLCSTLSKEGHNVLSLAVAKGHGAVASMLVRSGLATQEHINHRVAEDRGLTPLMYACLNGDKETIKLLLAFGADPRAKSLTGTPAILFSTFSANQNHLDSFETLIKSVSSHSRHVMLNETDECRWSPLHTMARTRAAGHINWSHILPRTLSKVSVNAVTVSGLSVMHLAAWNLSLDTLRLLLLLHSRQQQANKHHNQANPTKTRVRHVDSFGLVMTDKKKEVNTKQTNDNRFQCFVAKQLKTVNGKLHHTALDLCILRYLDENSTDIYTRAFDCILILCSSNFTASSTVGSKCQRVFDRVMISGNTAAVAGMLRSDDNSINLRSHHVSQATGTTNFKHNACTFSMGNMEGLDQHMYYCRESRSQVCQVCRDLCFKHKSSAASTTTASDNDSSSNLNSTNTSTSRRDSVNQKKIEKMQRNITGLGYWGFLESRVCECQRIGTNGHRCLALDRTDEKALAIKLYAPTSVLVPPDIRDRTITALDGLISELSHSLHGREKHKKESQGWTVGSKFSEDLQIDPKLKPFHLLSEEHKQSFREEIITFVSTVNYAGYNIIGPIATVTEIKELPEQLRTLSIFLGHNAHERWAEEKVRNGWHYAPVWLISARPHEKLDSCLVPFTLLSEYYRLKWIQVETVCILDTLNKGFRIIAIDKDKLPQLVEDLTAAELSKSIVRRHTKKFVSKSNKQEKTEDNKHRTRELTGTLLLASARWSLMPIMTELLNHGAEINKQDRFGYTSLMLAVKRNNMAVAKYLVDRGANLEMRNIHHFTALMLGSYLGNADMLKMLLKNGANLLAIDHRRMMSIHHSAYMGHTDATRVLGNELLSAGFGVDICAPHDADLVHHEHDSNSGKQVVVSTTASLGVNKGRGTGPQKSFLMHHVSKVMRHGFSRITSIFGGNLNDGSPRRAMMLHGSLSRAIHTKRSVLGAYDAILSGADNLEVFSPHELLQDRSMGGTVSLAMKRGTVEGLSPLALAVKASRLSVVQCLVKLGADPTAYDSTVFSPYERALIKSGEEEEKIAAHEASSEQSRILSSLMSSFKNICRCCICLPDKEQKIEKTKASTSKWEKIRSTAHKHESDKSRAVLARQIVAALNISQGVVQERCVLACRSVVSSLVIAVVLIVLLFFFSPLAYDNKWSTSISSRHSRIKPLKRVVTDSLTRAIGKGTNGKDAILKWWAWHESVFFHKEAHFVADSLDNASHAFVRNSPDYLFVGGLLLHQEYYDIGENKADCGFETLKVCHTVSNKLYHWTRPELSTVDDALDVAVNLWEGSEEHFGIGTITVNSYDSNDFIPPFVALSLVNQTQSLSTLFHMQNVSWANHETRFLHTKFSVYHQSEVDAYYCHVAIRLDFPVTGGTNFEIDVQEFTSPLLYWNRFAPSVNFLVFVCGLATYHLFILLYAFQTLGWLRCIRNRRNWVEGAMMFFMMIVAIYNQQSMDVFNHILQTPAGSSNKYHALYKVADLVKSTNDWYSLACFLFFFWNVVKVFPQAPIVGPKISAIIGTILAVNQLIYLGLLLFVCLVFSFRWNISLYGKAALFTTMSWDTKNSYFFALFRIPFADEFSNSMDNEVPRRPINTFFEVVFFVFILIMSNNYLGVFVVNWSRENKLANETWNEDLDRELRRKGMIKYNSNTAARTRAQAKHKNLKQFLAPALLLVGDDGLVFSGAGNGTNGIEGSERRQKRIQNAMNGTVSSIQSIGSSVDSLNVSLATFKRDMRQTLTFTRISLRKANTKKMANKVRKFMHSQSANRGQLGLARAPPQGRAPPKPNLEARIALVSVKKKKSEKVIIETQLSTPEPPPRPPNLYV